MKISLKILLPILAFAFGGTGAVSTINDVAALPLITAYVNEPGSGLCLPVTANCSQVDTHVNCLSIEYPTKRAYLKDSRGTCTIELWKIL